MPVYPRDIADLIRTPKFCGEAERSNGVGSEAKLDCGCFIEFQIWINHDSAAIEDIRYLTNGCGYMSAAGESLAGSLLGRSLPDLKGSFDPAIAAEVDRGGCLSTTVEALKAAFADHRDRVIEEFRGEKALICTCFGVSEETVEEFVTSKRPETVEQVAEELRAGSGCGSCRMLIQDIIESG